MDLVWAWTPGSSHVENNISGKVIAACQDRAVGREKNFRFINYSLIGVITYEYKPPPFPPSKGCVINSKRCVIFSCMITPLRG